MTRKTASDSVDQIYAEVRKKRALTRLPSRLAHVFEQSGFGAQPLWQAVEHLPPLAAPFRSYTQGTPDCFFG